MPPPSPSFLSLVAIGHLMSISEYVDPSQVAVVEMKIQ